MIVGHVEQDGRIVWLAGTPTGCQSRNGDAGYVNIYTQWASPVDKEAEIPVKSSNLKTVCYIDDRRILQVRFRSGRVYHYLDVPKVEYHRLMNSPSLGSYLHAYIKCRFSVREVTDED